VRSALAGADEVGGSSLPPQLTSASGAVTASPLGKPSRSFLRSALIGASRSSFFMLVLRRGLARREPMERRIEADR
jgi:hypothetical protein